MAITLWSLILINFYFSTDLATYLVTGLLIPSSHDVQNIWTCSSPASSLLSELHSGGAICWKICRVQWVYDKVQSFLKCTTCLSHPPAIDASILLCVLVQCTSPSIQSKVLFNFLLCWWWILLGHMAILHPLLSKYHWCVAHITLDTCQSLGGH